MRASDYDNPALRGLCDRCGHALWAEDESRAIPGMHEACAERELEEDEVHEADEQVSPEDS